MAEVIIIEDEDLEEGEITDDSVPEVYEVVSSFEAKRKKLPRHYAIQEKGSNSKHKTKYKQLTPNDKQQHKVSPPPLSSSKKHKSSCPRRSLERPRFSNGHESNKILNKYKSEYSKVSPSIKSNFKNSMNPSTFVQRSVVKVISKQFDEDNNYVDLLLEYQKSQGHKRKRKVDSSTQNMSLKPKDDGKQLSNHNKVEESISHNPNASQKYVKESNSTHGDIQKRLEKSSPSIEDVLLKENVVDIEESEDEEELRRIALATCAKRIPPQEKVVQLPDQLISCKLGSLSNVPNLLQTNQSSVTCYTENDSKVSDNYEVVDMDIDQESCAEDDNDLYVIDTNPEVSSNLMQVHEPEHIHSESLIETNSFSLQNSNLYSNSQSNEQFEEELMRAELIAGMNSRLKLLDQAKNNDLVEIKPSETDKKISIPFPHKECAITQPKSLIRPVLSSRNIPIKRTDLLKLSNVKLSKPTKISVPPTRIINASEKRFLISLSNDTTSDESDEEEKTDSSDTVAVSGIEALISDARQKSDLQANNVSCLSKAQQEEYNLLRKLLAEKDPMFSQPAVEEKQIPAKKPNLNFLTKQLSMAKDKLKKEMQGMAVVENMLVNKKKVYLASKLKVQHLKEQLHAAEQVRATNLDSWKTCEAKLGVHKKLVLKRKSVINMLENKLNNKKSDNEQNLSPISQ